MFEPCFENPLLSPIFDQIQSMIDYTHVSIYVVDGPDLTLTAYRGPIPQGHAALFNFPLAKAGGARAVIQSETPVLIADVLTDTPIARSFLEAQKDVPEDTFSYIRSWIGFPIKIGGETRGMLDIAHTERNFYSDQDIPRLAEYLQSVQATIENAILYTNLTQRSSELQTLYAVQQAINSHLDITTVLQLVADQACQLTSARQVVLFYLDRSNLMAVSGTGDNANQFPPANVLALTSKLVGEGLVSDQSVRIFDTLNDPRVDPKVSLRLGIRSLLIIPLKAPSRPMGVLVALDKEYGAFSPNDERVLTMLANGAATGLENARLYWEEWQRRQTAEGMQKILSDLTSNRPLADLLPVVLVSVSRLMEADASAFYLKEPAENLPKLAASYQLSEEQLNLLRFPFAWHARHHYLPGAPSKPVREPVRQAGIPSQSGLSIHCLGIPNIVEWVNQVRANPLYRSAQPLSSEVSRDFSSVLMVPVAIQEEVLGWIDVYWYQPHTFSADNLQVAETMASHIALAVDRDRLSKKAEELVRIQERQRIAQTLHDTVAQMLFRIGLEANWFQQNLAKEDGIKERVETLQRLVARSSYELRSAIFALGSQDLGGENNLIDLLQSQAIEFQNEFGIQTKLIASPNLGQLPSTMTQAIYRIVREALTNISKHASATAALVSIHRNESLITVTIQDNGSGLDDGSVIDPNRAGLHFGVHTMDQLVTSLGGRLFIGNNDDHGVVVQASFPLPGGDAS